MLAFDRKAVSYNDHSHIQRDTAAWVAEWLPKPEPDATCLEFGAGTGNFTKYLTTKFACVCATDIAPSMLIAGREHAPAAQWSVQNAWNPTVSDQKWDYVASCSVLQWADDPVTVLRKWNSLLKLGGRLVSGIYVRPSLPELGSLLPPDRQFGWHTAPAWIEFVNQAGFKVLRSESTTRKYTYPSAFELLRRLRGTGVTLPGKPLSVPATRTLIRNYEVMHAVPEGICTTWTFLRIEAAV
jgi:malonyl-CoA O-methyltransferase